LLRHSQNWHLDAPPSDLERQKLAQRQLKLNSQAWEEGELVEIRLAIGFEAEMAGKAIAKMSRRAACFPTELNRS
jgi:hypothetical protein